MQVVPSSFNDLANGDVRPHSWGAQISFEKQYDDAITFFTLDQSQLDGPDLLAASVDNPIQAWDFYEYTDFSERINYISVERELEFPYSVVSSIADFQLNNYDKYFTPNSSSPIGSYILPKRPVRLLQGLGGMLLPQFVGLTEGMPEVSRTQGTATFTALDFLTWIYDMPIRDTIIMVEVTTDEVLTEIFTQFGLSPAQFDLQTGRNRIPFLFFEKDQVKAGNVIRKLMEAEMGMLWLDEQGIIRFRPRLEQPDDPVYSFDSDSIVEIDTEGDDTIINHVTINTNVRVLQEAQVVYSVTDLPADASNTIPAGSSSPYRIELDDPTLNIVEPVYGQEADLSWFTTKDASGELVAGDIVITGSTSQTNSYTIFVQNNNSFDISISSLTLWGEPAKIVGGKATIYDLYDQDSIDKYEDKLMTIDNNFIQSISQARSLGLTIVDEYSEYADIINFEVKGNPALQLSDIVEVDYQEYSGQYRIIGIKNKLQSQKYTQILRGRKYTPREWFTLDVSELNGTAVLAP